MAVEKQSGLGVSNEVTSVFDDTAGLIISSNEMDPEEGEMFKLTSDEVEQEIMTIPPKILTTTLLYQPDSSVKNKKRRHVYDISPDNQPGNQICKYESLAVTNTVLKGDKVYRMVTGDPANDIVINKNGNLEGMT